MELKNYFFGLSLLEHMIGLFARVTQDRFGLVLSLLDHPVSLRLNVPQGVGLGGHEDFTTNDTRHTHLNQGIMNADKESTTLTLNPNTNHEEIPGNPSTATSSKIKLNDRSNGKSLKVLSEEDWAFWLHHGYVVIKQAVPREQALNTADFYGNTKEKTKTIHRPGTPNPTVRSK